MTDEVFKRILNRERSARKEAERLLEDKSLQLWNINQELENRVNSRTIDLQKALKKAEIASQTKDDFLSNMSHEIRTPLNAIIGFVDVMLSMEYDRKKYQKYLSIIKASGKNLSQIINDILDFAKIESGKFTIDKIDVDIKTSIEQTIQLFQSKAQEKEITLSMSISDDFPTSLKVDDTRIVQIISNFLSNAIKFTDNSGVIDVNISYDYAKGTLQVQIVDNGIGIEEKLQDKIFIAFEQEDDSTSRSFGGTGLGLSISKNLIALMSGELIFTSQKNVGSVFGFVLPAEVSHEKQETIDQEIEVPSFSGKILVAEDNEVNIILIEFFLDDYGLDYDIVRNGIEAIEAVKNTKYDLVLMDNQMPKMSGTQATCLIREFNTELPIIALSANVLKNEQQIFLDAGMNDTLAKPIEIKELEKIFIKYLL